MDELALAEGLSKIAVEFRYNIRAMRAETRDKNEPESEWEAVTGRTAALWRTTLQRECQIDAWDGRKKEMVKRPLRFTDVDWRNARGALEKNTECDPFLDWVSSLEWDGVERLPYLLHEVFGVPKVDPIAQWASKAPFLGAVRRAVEPGAKIDEIPVLVGPGRTGKSTYIRHLLPPQFRAMGFTDSIDFLASKKEFTEAVQGRIVVELAELTGFTRAEISKVKATMTRQDDGAVRLAYRADPEPLPRRFVMMGSYNPQQFLQSDKALQRRFVPITITRGRNIERYFTKENQDGSEEYITQLWAEAFHRSEVKGESPGLPMDLTDMQFERTQKYTFSDDILEDVLNDTLDKSTTYTMAEILVETGAILNLSEAVHYETRKKREMGQALRSCGWDKLRARHGTDRKTKVVWRHESVRKESEDEDAPF